MSGHSKWSQIKRQKGAADVKRGQLFSKLTLPIILAARSGGGDPEANFQLKMAVERARSANMPKENIDRAIKRGTGELGGAQIQEALYEAIGPFGTGILIETATDNKNRTSGIIRSVLTKFGGKLAGSGAASYLFDRMGKLLIKHSSNNLEELEMAVIDSGAEDFEMIEDILAVYTKANELESVKKYLEEKNILIDEAGLSWEPKELINLNKEQGEKMLDLIAAMDDLEDVTAVYANFDIKDKMN